MSVSAARTRASPARRLRLALRGLRARPAPFAAAAADSAAASDSEFGAYAPKVAFLFPGQGAQAVGMAKQLAAEVPAAAALFARASQLLGYDLLAVCTEGPKERLDLTAVRAPRDAPLSGQPPCLHLHTSLRRTDQPACHLRRLARSPREDEGALPFSRR